MELRELQKILLPKDFFVRFFKRHYITSIQTHLLIEKECKKRLISLRNKQKSQEQ
jgi:hypothetical protein